MDTHLYELSAAIRAIETAAEEQKEGDEPTAWLMAAAEVRGEFRDKAEGIALLIKEWQGDVLAATTEAKRLSNRAQATANRIKSLHDYLFQEMVKAGILHIKGKLISLRVQLSPPKVDIPDEGALPSNLVLTTLRMPKNQVPEELLEHVTGEAPDRKAIKAALDAGDEVPGARMDRGQWLAIR